MATDDIERLRFYQQQYLGAQDFEDQQAYHRDMLRRHDLSYHTWGIVAGLELFQQPKENAKDALDIYILPGMAVDGFGRTIFNLQPYPLDTALFQSFGDLNYHAVWLEYTEEPTRPPQVGYEQCDNANQFNRLGETFHVVVDPRAPFHDDITVAGKVAQLPPAHKPPQPGLEPITPYDASVPYQELPDEAGSPRWLIRLGSVKWDGRPGQQQFVQDNTVPPRINEGRQYAGSVTSELLTPAQKLVVRDRSTLVPLPPVDPQNPDGVEMTIEGSLEVNRLLQADGLLLAKASIHRHTGRDVLSPFRCGFLLVPGREP